MIEIILSKRFLVMNHIFFFVLLATGMFSLYNNLQSAAAAQAAHQAAQAVAANAGSVAPQPLPIPPPSNGVRVIGGEEASGVDSAQNR